MVSSIYENNNLGNYRHCHSNDTYNSKYSRFSNAAART